MIRSGGRAGRGAQDVLAIIARRGYRELQAHLPSGISLRPARADGYEMLAGPRLIATLKPGDGGNTVIEVPAWAADIEARILEALDVVAARIQDGPLPDRLMNAANGQRSLRGERGRAPQGETSLSG